MREKPVGLLWFRTDGVGRNWSHARDIGGKASQQLARAVRIEIEQEMLKPAVSVRDHQVNQLEIGFSAKDLRAICTQTVLAAFAPISEDVEAGIILPKSDQRIVIDVGAAAQRNHRVGESARGKAFRIR